ncbi:MAG: ParD-like antitoxin of type bacterial toxin-antitoxin system [Gemmatimonadetes bacterium]|nr:ParD-like antitoxin of type bacterial toxin-antitoxin system [Gemmatimonadota bacterium]
MYKSNRCHSTLATSPLESVLPGRIGGPGSKFATLPVRVPVKLSDELVLDARVTSAGAKRSIAGQIEFWLFTRLHGSVSFTDISSRARSALVPRRSAYFCRCTCS